MCVFFKVSPLKPAQKKGNPDGTAFIRAIIPLYLPDPITPGNEIMGIYSYYLSVHYTFKSLLSIM